VQKNGGILQAGKNRRLRIDRYRLKRDKTVPAICHFICGNPKESGYFSQNIKLKIDILGALLALD